MNRFLLALAVLSLLLSAPKAQAQDCVPEDKLALFPRTFAGKYICLKLAYLWTVPIGPGELPPPIRYNQRYLNSFARMMGTNKFAPGCFGGRKYSWLLVPVTAHERISQIKKCDTIIVHGKVIMIHGTKPVIEVNRIDHGGESLQLDLKFKGRE
ncbi:hypothetical protein MYX64_10680 [Nitrospinae bacterium AH_259_B05_G02_I21]|nr:hypothetical protein [Nitrospinae bacterium AH_259_B05_G02_I21]MDA2932636.1 hypothetical protein [Nitrospinae bacterium AH-259-F20]